MITQGYIDFFTGLEANNEKAWFHAHKKDYENHVKSPFLGVLEALIPALQELEAGISPEAKDALFRINRDIRFSKDKTPYNPLMKAGFAPGGKKSLLPGYYLGISAEKIHVGGGLFNVKGPELKKVRAEIAADTKAFMQVMGHASFKEHFGHLKGEQAKRLDKTLQPVLETTPHIANKQFYAMAELPLVDFLNANNLPEVLMHYFRAIHPLNQFLNNALS